MSADVGQCRPMSDDFGRHKSMSAGVVAFLVALVRVWRFLVH
jgi:hypothetical protein